MSSQEPQQSGNRSALSLPSSLCPVQSHSSQGTDQLCHYHQHCVQSSATAVRVQISSVITIITVTSQEPQQSWNRSALSLPSSLCSVKCHSSQGADQLCHYHHHCDQSRATAVREQISSVITIITMSSQEPQQSGNRSALSLPSSLCPVKSHSSQGTDQLCHYHHHCVQSRATAVREQISSVITIITVSSQEPQQSGNRSALSLPSSLCPVKSHSSQGTDQLCHYHHHCVQSRATAVREQISSVITIITMSSQEPQQSGNRSALSLPSSLCPVKSHSSQGTDQLCHYHHHCVLSRATAVREQISSVITIITLSSQEPQQSGNRSALSLPSSLCPVKSHSSQGTDQLCHYHHHYVQSRATAVREQISSVITIITMSSQEPQQSGNRSALSLPSSLCPVKSHSSQGTDQLCHYHHMFSQVPQQSGNRSAQSLPSSLCPVQSHSSQGTDQLCHYHHHCVQSRATAVREQISSVITIITMSSQEPQQSGNRSALSLPSSLCPVKSHSSQGTDQLCHYHHHYVQSRATAVREQISSVITIITVSSQEPQQSGNRSALSLPSSLCPVKSHSSQGTDQLCHYHHHYVQSRATAVREQISSVITIITVSSQEPQQSGNRSALSLPSSLCP